MEHHQLGQAPWGAGAPHFVPFLGGTMLIIVLLLVLGGLYLARKGRSGPPPWALGARQTPELEARKILSTRFANGEIAGEEFLERASVLNWTPGVEPLSRPKSKRR